MMSLLNIQRKSLGEFKRFISSIKKPQSKYDVIIVGGGHNGLVAASYLAKGGKKVCVLESRHVLGGAAVTEEIVPGFKFSRASYVLGLLRPQIYFDLKLEHHGLRVHTRNPSSYTPINQKYWNKSTPKSLTLGTDAKKNNAEISKFSVKDAEAFPKYEHVLNGYIDALTPLLDSFPPNLSVLRNSGSITKLRNLPQFYPLFKSVKVLGMDINELIQFLTAPTIKILDDWFESEPLKASLITDSVIGAMIGPNSPGSGYVLLHHVMAETNGIKGAWGFPIGGMGAVTQAMTKAASAAGAELFVEHPVKEILVDSGVAKGVKMQNGDEIQANFILSNATPKVTFLDLLPSGSLPSQFVKQVKGIDYTSPVCKINVALKEIPNFIADPNINGVMPHHQCTIHLNCEKSQYIEEAYQYAKNGQVPKRPMIEITIPSSVDPTIAPPGCHVALIFTQYYPLTLKEENEKVKESYVENVFSSIEDYAPGFKKSIVGYEALTPLDLEKIFGLTGGNIFHGSMSLDQLYTSRPTAYMASPSTPIKGLFLCGSGAHPGGGVMGAPGQIAAKAVLKA